MTDRELLVAARGLIENPENWTTGAYARDSSGKECSWAAEDAVQWCATGALCSVEGGHLVDQFDLYLWYRQEDEIVEFGSSEIRVGLEHENDRTCHLHVLDLFDTMIEMTDE